SAISSNTPSGQLKDLLINNSPLSDEVLLAFINRQTSTPPGIFKEALTPNLPSSDTVNNALLQKLNTIPTGIANQIKIMQGYNPGFRTLTSILRDIGTIENERAQTLSQTISYYAQNDSLNNLTNLLENEHTDYANQLLTGLYIADNNLALASLKLNSLPNSTFDEQAFININNMLINLATEEKSVFEMDSLQEQIVRQIATMNTSCLARTNARAILLLVYNERYDEEIPQMNSARMASNNANNTGLTNSLTKFSIYPNPASENVELHYSLSAQENGLLEIFSVIGNKVASYTLSSTEEQINISVKNFESSIYMYRFSVNDVLIEEGKLIILNK
ncbi:MAG: T9SS type A sorting domain-containing protein, partial [Candidatus Aquicultor sp.]